MKFFFSFNKKKNKQNNEKNVKNNEKCNRFQNKVKFELPIKSVPKNAACEKDTIIIIWMEGD